MEIQNLNRILTGAILCLAASGARAAIVYENVDYFSDVDLVSESFEIETEGTYEAFLTDMVFPVAFEQMGMAITSSLEKFGQVDGPGSFTFDATPGTYWVNSWFRADTVPGTGEDFGLAGIRIQTLGAVTDVSAVPIPGSGLLMASALVAGAGAMRKRAHRQ